MTYKIALIDSGLGAHESKYKPYIIDQYQIQPAKVASKMSEAVNPHAELILNIFIEQLREVQIYDIRILDENLQSDLGSLKRALELCAILPVDAVNISLGYENIFYGLYIHKDIQKLIKQKKMIVSAYSNHAKTSYPACLSGVIGVKMNNSLSEGELLAKHDVYYANGLANIVQSDVLEEPKGNSFAAAKVLALMLKEKELLLLE
jgi:hypothetical protein